MKANFEKKTIEMNKTEAVAAGKLNSEKCNELKALREMFPTFNIVVVKAHTKADHFKGLTVAYMENYITTNKKELLPDFYALRGKDSEGKEMELSPVATYGELKMWFLKNCPEISTQADKVRDIIKTTKAS